jgi:DNA-binding transcriptional MerR regulator
MERMKVGQLARRTGLSVRTLHHYDEIGLLAPVARTPSGHRLYGPDEVRRLQRIASLRQLGLSLEEIGSCLGRPDFSLERVLAMQIHRLEEDIRQKERLRSLLQGLHRQVQRDEGVTVDDLTRTIQGTVAIERYYTPLQLEELARRAAEAGEDAMRRGQEQWAELFAAYGDAMARGIDPAAEEVLALARRSAALIEEFTGGAPDVRASLARMYEGEGHERVLASQGMSLEPGLWEYMTRAAAALRSRDGA